MRLATKNKVKLTFVARMSREGLYELRAVGDRLFALSTRSSAASTSHSKAKSSVSLLPSRLVATDARIVPRVGRLTGYSNGAVSIVFEDRTVARIEPGAESVQFILPDGTQSDVSLARPMDLGFYIGHIVEYQRFLLQSPQERARSSFTRRINQERVTDHILHVHRLLEKLKS